MPWFKKTIYKTYSYGKVSLNENFVGTFILDVSFELVINEFIKNGSYQSYHSVVCTVNLSTKFEET